MRSYKLFEEKKAFIFNRAVVGIDPAKNFIDCAFLNEHGLSIGKPRRFKQSSEGFFALLKYVKTIYSDIAPIFSIECSCRMWVKLAYFLKKQDCEVVMFSPLNTYHGRTGINLNYSHTDPKDALIIATGTKDGKFNFYQELDDKHQVPRNLSIHFEKITHDITRAKNRLRSKLEEFFPEFFQVINLDTLTGIHLLKSYFLPHHYLEMNVIKESENILLISKKYHGMKLLISLQKLAEVSVGVRISPKRELGERLVLTSLIDQLELLLKQQSQFSKEIIKYYSETTPFKIITSVKGISKLSAARFLAEASGIERFEHYKQLEKYAGASLRLNQSGHSNGTRRLNKIGNKRLLKVLYFMLANTSKYVPEVRIKYLKRQIKKPCYNKNLFACLPNLLKLIFSLVKANKPYEINENREKIVEELSKEYDKQKPKNYDKLTQHFKIKTA